MLPGEGNPSAVYFWCYQYIALQNHGSHTRKRSVRPFGEGYLDPLMPKLQFRYSVRLLFLAVVFLPSFAGRMKGMRRIKKWF